MTSKRASGGTKYGVARYKRPKDKSEYEIYHAAALVVAFAMPAFAANEFYVVQDKATKKCSIVEAEPMGGTMTALGTAHKTHAEAEIAMKDDKVCVTQ